MGDDDEWVMCWEFERFNKNENKVKSEINIIFNLKLGLFSFLYV